MQVARLFVAHARADEDSRLQLLHHEIVAAAYPHLGDRKLEVVLGRDDFKQYMAAAGGWDGWVLDVVRRVDYNAGTPWFSAIVVPTRVIGHATAVIINTALAAGRPVLLLEDRLLHTITGVVHVDPRDFKAGWRVRV